MAAFSTKGLTVWLQKKPGSSPTPVAATSITNAKPAVATVAAGSIAQFKKGDLVTVLGSGMSALDSRSFTVGTITTNSFPLTGSDASGATAPSTTGTLTNYEADMVEFCVSSIEYAAQAGAAINVGTTCDPTAQIAGDPQAGTLTVTGFQDYTKPGFIEFMHAVNDQLPRILEIRLPAEATTSPNKGYVLFSSATATGFGTTWTVGQAAGFTGEFTLGAKPTWLVEGTPILLREGGVGEGPEYDDEREREAA